MTEEIWKDITGYEGLYQVSSLGRYVDSDYIVAKVEFNLNEYYII